MTWKRTIRPATDVLAKYSGLLWAYERGMRSKITVLMYHRVLEDADCDGYPFPSLVMPRSLFEAQLDHLSEHAHVLPVSDALRQGRDFPGGPKPTVCLTFDDGYADNFEIVAPLLETRGLRGTFFITAGAVQGQKPLWYDRAATAWTLHGGQRIRERIDLVSDTDEPGFETRQSWIDWLKSVSNDQRQTILTSLETGSNGGAVPCQLMDADQVRQLAERGHEIGSHTLWHPILTTMGEHERRNEIEGAKELLFQWTKREVAGFCYPNGNFDPEVIRQLQEAGHSYACTTQPGRNDDATNRFKLRRIELTRDRVAAADGRFDPLGFRAEISLFREGLRRLTRLRGRRAER
jgi:peptidoglycan/xylan/chitin deacetylase (PgdA/CDA1 family)